MSKTIYNDIIKDISPKLFGGIYNKSIILKNYEEEEYVRERLYSSLYRKRKG